MKEILEIKDIQNTVSKYGSIYGAERIYLFGSYARGEATENSDIDLRVDKGTIRGISLGGLLEDIQASLEKKVDLLTTNSLPTDFLEEIKREEVLLYEHQ